MKQKRSPEIDVSGDGWEEIDRILENVTRGLIIEAARFAYKEGHRTVDKTYVKEASKRLRILEDSTMKWLLRVVLVLSISLALFQMGSLVSLSLLYQPLLWILPVFVVFLFLALTFTLKDYL